jgi:hypothetical protein
VTCYLLNLLTGAAEVSREAACFFALALSPVTDTFLSDPMWRPPLPLDRFVA